MNSQASKHHLGKIDLKTLIVVGMVILFKSLGDVNLSHGMKQIGKVNASNISALLGTGLHMLTNGWLYIGIAFLIGHALVYLAALSWLDLSYMLPMTSFTYVMTALLAEWFLHEKISAIRWAAIAIISFGVLIVGLGERKQKRRQAPQSSRQRDSSSSARR